MPKRKQKWRRLASWRQGGRRRARLVSRLHAAFLLWEYPGPLMNLLGEVVVDLYEEIFLLARRREQEQLVIMEYAMRLDLALSQGGPEWAPFREADIDILEVALVAVNVWICLNNRHKRDYTDLEGIQKTLRRDGSRIGLGIMYRTRRQGRAFRYRFKKPAQLKLQRGRRSSSERQTKRIPQHRSYRPP